MTKLTIVITVCTLLLGCGQASQPLSDSRAERVSSEALLTFAAIIDEQHRMADARFNSLEAQVKQLQDVVDKLQQPNLTPEARRG